MPSSPQGHAIGPKGLLGLFSYIPTTSSNTTLGLWGLFQVQVVFLAHASLRQLLPSPPLPILLLPGSALGLACPVPSSVVGECVLIIITVYRGSAEQCRGLRKSNLT